MEIFSSYLNSKGYLRFIEMVKRFLKSETSLLFIINTLLFYFILYSIYLVFPSSMFSTFMNEFNTNAFNSVAKIEFFYFSQ